MDKVILIASGKGGTGKTVLTASIGCAVSDKDKKVLIIDMNFGLRNLDVVLGLENMILNNAFDVIKGKCSLQDAVVQDKAHENLYILLASQTKEISDITNEEFKAFIDNIKDEYDYIFIDCPSGTGIKNLISAADKVVVITTPEIMSVRNADKLVSVIRQSRIFNINFIINRFNEKLVSKYDLMTIEDVKEVLPVDLLGIIPEEEEVYIRANQGKSFEGCGEAGECVNRIAMRILGENIPLKDYEKSKGYLKRFAHIFRKKSE